MERNTQGFLEALAAGGGQPLKTLSPKDTRAVLVGAQLGVKVALSGIIAKDEDIDFNLVAASRPDLSALQLKADTSLRS